MKGVNMFINTLEDLVYSLLSEIELGITPDGYLYDVTTQQVLRCKDKLISASVNPQRPAISTDLTIAFDPVFDNKIMNYILGYYLQKSEAQGLLEPLTISEQAINNPRYNDFDFVRSKKSAIVVVCNNRITYTSNGYYQKGLKYSDVILRIGGDSTCDLSKFDSIPEEAISVVGCR